MFLSCAVAMQATGWASSTPSSTVAAFRATVSEVNKTASYPCVFHCFDMEVGHHRTTVKLGCIARRDLARAVTNTSLCAACASDTAYEAAPSFDCTIKNSCPKLGNDPIHK